MWGWSASGCSLVSKKWEKYSRAVPLGIATSGPNRQKNYSDKHGPGGVNIV